MWMWRFRSTILIHLFWKLHGLRKTKAVMLAHTLGNPFDLKAVKEFCDRHNLWLIEDNCDALGSVYTIDGESRLTGTIGDIGTSSFYPPHHMTMGEGGAVYTENPLLHTESRVLSVTGEETACAHRDRIICAAIVLTASTGNCRLGYDHKYVYSHFGYNLKATDMQAAVGCAQLQQVPVLCRTQNPQFQLSERSTERNRRQTDPSGGM